MRTVPRIAIDVPVNATGDALAALERFMLEQDYSGRCRSDARKIVARIGDVSACYPSCLDREHIAVATEVYIDALPSVDFNDGAWGDPGSWMTVEDLVDAGRRVPRDAAILPPELDDDLGDSIPFMGDRLIWEAQ
jgi:hypothetical protein